jgi:hypothetical protein
MIKSRFNSYVYIHFVICAFLFFASFYLLFYPGLHLKGKHGHEIPAPVVGLLLLVMDAFLFYSIAKRLFLITVTENEIQIRGLFQRHSIHKSDINTIDLLSMEEVYWTVGVNTICVSIYLVDGRKIILTDLLYSNISTVKQMLFEIFKEKIRPLRKLETSEGPSASETDFEIISGNKYFNVNSIIFFGMTAFLVILIFAKPSFKIAAVLTIPIVAFFFALGSQLHYFLVSNRRIVVKNHFFPWFFKSYELNDIIAVNFEQPYRRSEALRITTKDFKSKSFGAGSLRQKHWNALRRKLKGLVVN